MCPLERCRASFERHEHTLVDVAVQEQGSSADLVEILDGIVPRVHLLEAVPPSALVDGIDLPLPPREVLHTPRGRLTQDA